MVDSILRGPDWESNTPMEEACLDRAKSKISTPIHANSAQLSGPEIPGAQIKEAGNLILMVSRALSRSSLEFASWGASVITINDG